MIDTRRSWTAVIDTTVHLFHPTRPTRPTRPTLVQDSSNSLSPVSAWCSGEVLRGYPTGRPFIAQHWRTESASRQVPHVLRRSPKGLPYWTARHRTTLAHRECITATWSSPSALQCVMHDTHGPLPHVLHSPPPALPTGVALVLHSPWRDLACHG